MPRRARSLHAALLVAALLAAGCGSRQESPSPAPAKGPAARPGSRDVVLVTIDTLRYDATGFSGAGKVETPALDRLAEGGRVFIDTHAHAVLTLPSHASILTGLFPYQHGIRDNAGFVLKHDVPTLATLLKASGYETAAFVSAFTLDARFGLRAGFDVYDDRTDGYSGRISSISERPGDKTVALALGWWSSHGGRPRLLFVHLFTPHFPYEPGEPFATRYRDRPYYGEAAMADAQVRPLLETIESDRDPGAIVVFTSDHGEALGDHGEASHGIFCYESTLKVPLVLWAPGLVTPGKDPRPARHVDIVPTVLSMLGLPIPAGLPGRSLLAPAPAKDEGSYFEALDASLNRGWAPLFGRLEGGRKAIDLPVPELYDLASDPGESANLARKEPAVLHDLLSRVPPAARTSAPREEPEPEVVEKLRSLGYLTAGSPPVRPARLDASYDPKSLVSLGTSVDDAVLRYRKGGDAAGAIRDLEAILARNPRMAYVYSHLSVILAENGRTAEAIGVLSRAVAMGVGGERMKTKLALGLNQAGKPRDAWALLEPLSSSEDPETQDAMGIVAAALGRPDEARARFDKALSLDPTYPSARVDLAVLLFTQGKMQDAKQSLDRALSENPYLPDGWNTLGAIRAQGGDLKGAVEAWERALKLNPRLPVALFNLATASARLGDRARAISALERLVPLVQGEPRKQAEAMLASLRRGA